MTMTKTIIFCTVAIALTGSAVTLAQAQQQEPQMNPAGARCPAAPRRRFIWE